MLTIYFIVISWSPDSHSLVSQHTIHSENKSKVIIFKGGTMLICKEMVGELPLLPKTAVSRRIFFLFFSPNHKF